MKFIEPNTEFVDWLIKYAGNRIICDVGCGEGHLTKMIADQGGRGFGVDIMFDYESMDLKYASKFIAGDIIDFPLIKVQPEKLLIVMARPCHGNFVERVIDAKHKDIELLYLGLKKNVETDLGLGENYCDIHYRIVPAPECEGIEIALSVKSEYKNSDRIDIEENVDLEEEIENFKDEIGAVDADYEEDLREQWDKLFPGYSRCSVGGSLHGRTFEKDFKDCTWIYEDYRKEEKRPVEVRISTYYVGEGHYHVAIEQKNNECLWIDHEAKRIERIYPNDVPFYIPEGRTYKYTGKRDSKRFVYLSNALDWIREQLKTEFKTNVIEIDY